MTRYSPEYLAALQSDHWRELRQQTAIQRMRRTLRSKYGKRFGVSVKRFRHPSTRKGKFALVVTWIGSPHADAVLDYLQQRGRGGRILMHGDIEHLILDQLATVLLNHRTNTREWIERWVPGHGSGQ